MIQVGPAAFSADHNLQQTQSLSKSENSDLALSDRVANSAASEQSSQYGGVWAGTGHSATVNAAGSSCDDFGGSDPGSADA